MSAKLMLQKSYSPYSHFRIGAAVLRISMCAERVALFKAVSEGHNSSTDLAVAFS